MQLSRPKGAIWLLALILAALAIISKYVGIPFIGGFVRQVLFLVYDRRVRAALFRDAVQGPVNRRNRT